MTRINSLAATAALAASVSGIALTGTALAQERRGDGHDTVLDFAVIDTDGNGSLSRAELQARAVARLGRADANGDGALDREELLVIMPGRGDAPFRVFSVDPDTAKVDRFLALMGATEAGRVELTAVADRRVNMLLAAVDTDRDAAISQAEADARAEAGTHAREHRQARRDHDGGDDGRSDDRSDDRSSPPQPNPHAGPGRGPRDARGWNPQGGQAEAPMTPAVPMPSPGPAPDAAAPVEAPLPGAPDQP